MKDFRKYFVCAIQGHYPEQSKQILAQTDDHYHKISPDTAFAQTSKNPIDKRLDFTSYFLALIKTLDGRGEGFDSIRKICLEVVIAYVQPGNQVQAFLKRLLPKLIDTWVGQRLISAFHKRVSINQNKDGFIANIITNKQETYGLGYGIDIIECGICKLFKKHNFGKYASILCEVDEITSSLAGLTLIRSGTIANGAQKCDFRFKRN
jgi:hypothetical protein